MEDIDRAINAIKARENGIWDDPSLISYGPLTTSIAADVFYIKTKCLEKYGFIIGTREPQLHTDFLGKYMVAEAYEDWELPTKDGSNGPWALVGDSLSKLVDEAFKFLDSIIIENRVLL